jgi:hypothetical protein
VSIRQSHTSAASSYDRPLAIAKISCFALFVAESAKNAEERLGLRAVLLAQRRLRPLRRLVERLTRRKVVQLAAMSTISSDEGGGRLGNYSFTFTGVAAGDPNERGRFSRRSPRTAAARRVPAARISRAISSFRGCL